MSEMSENEERRTRTTTETHERAVMRDKAPTRPDRDPRGETRSNNPIPPARPKPPRDDG